jgi:anti-sigma factor RsiW
MSLFRKNDSKTEHQWVEERLSAYLDGELSSRERDAVEHHLARC